MKILSWVRDRLTERTTYVGLTLLLSAAGIAIDPATLGQIGTGVSAAIGLALVAWQEKKEK